MHLLNCYHCSSEWIYENQNHANTNFNTKRLRQRGGNLSGAVPPFTETALDERVKACLVWLLFFYARKDQEYASSKFL